MNFFKLFLCRIFNQKQLATNESIVLFEDKMLADSEFYQDVQAWGGDKIAAESKT